MAFLVRMLEAARSTMWGSAIQLGSVTVNTQPAPLSFDHLCRGSGSTNLMRLRFEYRGRDV
jgi:hypothetical protein